MKLTSKPLAILIVTILFGGIAITSATGLWQTTNSRTPAAYDDGEFVGQANPADIRGSYTFGDIQKAFGVEPKVLAEAFGVQSENLAAFQVKSLEEIYGESGVAIDTNSVRMFVALYKGLPYDLKEDTFLLPEAVAILEQEGAQLTPEQIVYLEAHTVGQAEQAPALLTETPAAAATSLPPESEHVVKGKTTFQELLDWGLPVETIETVLGGKMPVPAVTIKDHCTAQGLDFESIKAALQAEVDKVE